MFYGFLSRVSTGIPGYGLRMEMIRNFFPFPLWKRFRKSGNFWDAVPELRNMREFRNVPEHRFGKFPEK